MATDTRRVIVNRAFDAALHRLLESFVGEGFTVRSVDGGDLRGHASPGRRLRYAVLEVEAIAAPSIGCRLTLFECTERCTLLTAENRRHEDGACAGAATELNTRIADALRVLTCSFPAVDAA